MTSEGVGRLVTFCRQRVGPSLRTVTVYEPGEYDVAFIRDDLRTEYAAAEFDELIEAARSVHEILVPLQETAVPIGAHTATVHAFERAIVVQLAVTEEWGCLVSMDRTVGSNVSEFIKDCLARLAD